MLYMQVFEAEEVYYNLCLSMNDVWVMQQCAYHQSHLVKQPLLAGMMSQEVNHMDPCMDSAQALETTKLLQNATEHFIGHVSEPYWHEGAQTDRW